MALKVSQARDIPAFLAMQVMQRAKEMQAAGEDLVHLEVGQPSTPPPATVSRALQSCLKHTASHGYSVGLGLPELRQRIAAHYQDWYGLQVDWQKIAVTPGSSLGFAIAFLSAFDKGIKLLSRPPAIRHITI